LLTDSAFRYFIGAKYCAPTARRRWTVMERCSKRDSRVAWMNAWRFILVCAFSALVLCPPITHADEADDQYAVAAEHYRQERWQLAVDEFTALIEKHADHKTRGEAEFFLAESQVQLGEFTKAAEHYRAYLDREPQGRYAKSALFRGGESAYLGGEGDAAAKQLSAFLEVHRNDELAAYALPYLGRIALDANKLEEAEKHFRATLDEFPSGPLTDEARFGLARTHEQQGKHAAAADGFAALAARKDCPIADVAQFRLGLVRYNQGDFAAAEKAFADLNASFKDTKLAAKSEYWQALSIKAQRRYAEAAERMIDAVERDSQHALAANMRYHAGDALLASDNAKAAIEQFDIVLKDFADSPIADDALLGKTQAMLNADPAAADALAEAWKQFPESPLARVARRMQAQALLENREYDGAIDQLKALVSEKVPSDDAAKTEQLTASYFLAIALHGAGKHDEALAEFAKLENTADDALKTAAQLGRVSTLVRMERYQQALPLLEQFLAAHSASPDTSSCLSELAFCHAGLGQFNDARRRYDEFCKHSPDQAALLATTHRLAEMAYRGEQRAWAAELFTVLAADGNPSEYVARGLSGQAWCQFTGDDLAGSAATFLKLVEQFPTDPLAAEGALVRGKALEKLDQYDPALLMYRTVIETFPESQEMPSALLAAAELHERLKQGSDAERYYRQFLERCPQHAKVDFALYQLAWLLRENDASMAESEKVRRVAESETLFERVRHQHKQSTLWPDAMFRLAEAARDRKDAKTVAAIVEELTAAAEAKADDGKATVETSTLAHAYYLQGRLAADLGDWAGAEKAMTLLAERCPKSDLVLASQFWVAEAAYRQGEYEQAATRFDALSTQSETASASWRGMIPLRRAQVYAQQKQWSEAIALASTIEKEHPGFAQQYEADYLIGRAHAAEGKFDDARTYYTRVTQSAQGGKTETAAMAQWMIGESYFHQKDYATAVKEYLRVEILYAYPKWQAAALVQAGKAYESDGQWQEAVKLYTQVLRKYAQTEQATEASTRLRVVEQRANAGSGATQR
jgi:TolA-binding protein